MIEAMLQNFYVSNYVMKVAQLYVFDVRKYHLIDVGYTIMTGFIASYQRARYHSKEHSNRAPIIVNENLK